MSRSSEPQPRGIDPRGPRLTAAITATLLLIGVFLSLLRPVVGTSTIFDRAIDPGFLVLLAVDLLFIWGFASPRTAPWGVLFRHVVQPRLSPPAEWEDPRPVRFAQGVGFAVVTVGLVLHLVGVPWALPIAGAAAFVAAFLNAAFGLCLGCQLYLGLARLGVIRSRRTTARA